MKTWAAADEVGAASAGAQQAPAQRQKAPEEMAQPCSTDSLFGGLGLGAALGAAQCQPAARQPGSQRSAFCADKWRPLSLSISLPEVLAEMKLILQDFISNCVMPPASLPDLLV